jgi:hypothetical protein
VSRRRDRAWGLLGVECVMPVTREERGLVVAGEPVVQMFEQLVDQLLRGL